MDQSVVILICAVYGAVLFLAAWLADQERFAARLQRHEATLYALALAVYCSSWTFFGAVGTAATRGWDYLPIYLGPILVFAFAPMMLRRILAISKRHNLATLSDFLAARYGRSRALAAAVTGLAAAGALPYIALQLKSVAMSFEALTALDGGRMAAADDPSRAGVFVVAALLAAFAILFGARTADAARRNRGLVVAIALESLVKILALGLVAVLACAYLAQGRGDDTATSAAFTAQFPMGSPTVTFITLTGLAMAAVLCLPRQFHMLITEAPDRGGQAALTRARWVFPAYLVVTSVLVIPIALAGRAVLPATASPDLYVLALPAALGGEVLSLLAFLGGLSAATGMVVVAAVALSIMITHDILAPLILKAGRRGGAPTLDGGRLLALRRWVVVALMLMSYGYWVAAGDSGALADIGLIAFVAVAQLAPALIGGVFWAGGHRDGALAGLAAGGVLWAYTLVLPAVLGDAGLAASGLQSVWGGFVDPHGLIAGVHDPITHGALVSLSANLAFYIAFSIRARPRLVDSVQAAAFVRRRDDEPAQEVLAQGRAKVTIGDLRSLAERFLTRPAAQRAFAGFVTELSLDADPQGLADWRLVQKTERLLAGALGSSTARIVMGSALSREDVPLTDILAILDETNEERQFKRHLLQATLENITQGVSVVDQDLRLIAWNGVYRDLFDYPPDLIRVGRPIEDLIRYNAERGEMGPGEAEAQVTRRLEFLRAGGPHAFERVNRDGRALKIVGNPMPGGGYVTTFTDITAEKRAEGALREAKAELEQRVAERTRDLATMADDLDSARRLAERSEVTKTRFLAAASHDLQQPLNAARLFAAALAERLPAPDMIEGRLAANVDRSIRSANDMLTGLLDLSKFDQGGVAPHVQRFALAQFFDELAHDHAPIAREAAVELRVRDTDIWALTDKDLLRSVVQNLLSNALRYTETGGVLLAARQRGGGRFVSIEVWDTGPGIPEDAQGRIFQEFRRLHTTDRSGARGAGLGLAIASRAAALLGSRVMVRSRLGRGSKFSITAPAAAWTKTAPPSMAPTPATAADLRGLRVLCLDDEPAVLAGMGALLESWGCAYTATQTSAAALAAAERADDLDVVLVDYHLADEETLTGLDVVGQLRAGRWAHVRAALVSADPSPDVHGEARRRGCAVIAKPVDAEALYAFMAQSRRVAAE